MRKKKGMKIMKMKKLAALALAVAMTVGMSATTFAKDVDTGKNGEYSIKIDNASYGKTYEIYQIFEARHGENGAISYVTKTEISKDLGMAFYTDSKPDADGYYAVMGVENATLGDVEKTWIQENATLVKMEAAGQDSVLNFTGLQPGYYYINTGVGTAITVDSTTTSGSNTATIKDKGVTEPTIPIDPEDPAKKAEDATLSIGDTTTYTLKFVGTNYVIKENGTSTKVTNYTINDRSSQVKIDVNSVKVKVAGTERTNTSATLVDGGMDIVIPWVDDNGNHLYATDAVVEITYEAEVIDLDASNTVTFNWNNDQQFGEGTATVYNFDFTLNKVDGSQEKLDGAEFKLKDEEGNYIKFVRNATDGYKVATSEQKETADATDIITVGTAKIDGLAAGTYWLEEVKAPAGYNLLQNDVKVVIEQTEGNVAVVKMLDEKDELQPLRDLNVKIVNLAGTELPSTGGIGTTIFYVVGGILVAAAVVLLVTKKRMNRA